ncbi:uncharacterized protein Fot_49727 [Forsythia ovata]|uniref:Uncharacterized protein n=1 Tax=Forsythia ovata TaxID=205694 RepID=A0ABD1QCN7_9LAMI
MVPFEIISLPNCQNPKRGFSRRIWTVETLVSHGNPLDKIDFFPVTYSPSMEEDVAVVQNGPSANPCCTEWKRQYLKLHEKYSKLELRRNALREGISMVNEKFDSIEKENKILKQALEGLKLQASKEKDEKEKESTMRVSLENEVSALKAELLVLQQNGNSAAEEADGAVLQLQGRLAAAETEINRLRELLDKEIVRADLEKKNSEKGEEES